MTKLPGRLIALMAYWVLASACVAPCLADEPPDRPIVSGFERFSSEPETDLAAGGQLLLGELNCTSCHQARGDLNGNPDRKQAPILDRVGARVKVDHLRAYLSNPQGVKPGTTMPHLFQGWPKAEAETVVEALVHFLASTGSVKESAPNRKLVASGKTLFEQTGCAACHAIPESSSPPLATSVPLGDLAGKYTYASLAGFVQDPLSTRPSGRMPSMNLKPDESQAVASFLLKNLHVETVPSLSYHYYEGDWEVLPDFDRLKPVSTGMTDDFEVNLAQRHGDYAIRFEGTLDVERAGGHSFFTASDDGSKLYVDDKPVVDNDGIHPNQRRTGRLRLDRGRHKIVVTFFQKGGQEELEVEYEAPGLSRRPLAPALSPIEGLAAPKVAGTKAFVLDPAKVEAGRSLFASVGCASCHQLRENDKPVVARPASKPLADLKADTGCLAPQTPRGVPNYKLSTRQRASIGAALAAASATSPRKPTSDPDLIAKTLVTFNCYSCHVRDGVGGVEEGRNEVFATTQKEMGDEGRLPPLLTGVGGKLTEAWLKHVLADGAKDRPYMLTRMPKFGEGNVGHLVKPMATVDLVAPVPLPHFDVPEKRVKATGRFIVGSQAFNCGSCHQFKEFQAAGIQALDMTLMTRRLRRDWFHRYVVDPQAFRPGTRMPAAWPGGKSQLETIYDGDTVKQIESIWSYLSDGTSAAVPYGLGRDPIPLVADKQPVIYRNFIQGAGPRAIGVGYPGQSNLAFDANDLRLALIWQGAFIDASKHWIGRGEGFQGPLGDNILSLPAGPAFAVLAKETDDWPRQTARELGQKFRGYVMSSPGWPRFVYDVGEVRVEDLPTGDNSTNVPLIHRQIKLSTAKPSKGLYFRAAVGQKIESIGNSTFQVDGEWKVKIVTEGKPIIRNSGGKFELIVPVLLETGKATISQEFIW